MASKANPIRIRRARPEDARAITTIARVTWPDTYSGLIPEEAQQVFLDRAYAPGTLARAIAREDHWFFVAEQAGTVIGYAEFGPVGAGDVELFRIYVHPVAQRSGAGSALLEAGITAIREASDGPRRLFLRVEEGNHKGMRFYERHGFTSRPADPIVVEQTRCCALEFEREI